MKSFTFLVICLITFTAKAGNVSGLVTDNNKQLLAFASIVVKGTTQGTAANSAGYYSLDLKPGTYTLIAHHVGNKSVEKQLNVTSEDVHADFELPVQEYDLGNVIVKNGEDPAYEIIRNAIKKKAFYEKEHKQFEAEVYIKACCKYRKRKV